MFTDISFSVHAGEIVALAGLMERAVVKSHGAIFGIDSRDAGRVVLNGKTVPAGSPTTSMAAGMGFGAGRPPAPGLGHGHSPSTTTSLSASLKRLSKATDHPPVRRVELAADWATRLRLKYGRLEDPANRPCRGQPAKGRPGQVVGPTAIAAHNR